MIYLVDFTLLVIRLLGSFLRKARMIAWLTCLVSPVKVLYEDFKVYRAEKLRELSYNSQTKVFEKLLNDKFPNEGNGIYIQNTSSAIVRTYIFSISEHERETYIRSLSVTPFAPYIYSLTELNNDFDFIVFVPAILVFDIFQMRALIRKYKLTGKRYSIQTY